MARLGARVNYAFTPEAVRDLSGHKHGFGREVREGDMVVFGKSRCDHLWP